MHILLYIFLFSLVIILITVIHRYIKFNSDYFFNFKNKKKIRHISKKYIQSKKKRISSNINNTKSYSSLELEKLAKNAIKSNNYAKAEEYYILALENTKSSNIPIFLNYLSSIYVKQGNHSKNIKCLKKLEKNFTLTGDNYISLGLSYLAIGNIESAKKYVKEACLINPENTNYINHLSEIFIINNEVSKLEIFLEELYEDTKSNSILLCLANVYEKLSDKKNLKKIYSLIEKNNPDDKEIIKKLKKNLD